MNLTKAIEILGFIKQDRIPVGELDELRAINIGIEAFKRIEDGREKGYDYFGHLLPGETKE